MFALSDAIRSKPDWHLKRKDPAIRAKWKGEALSQPQKTRVTQPKELYEESPDDSFSFSDEENDSDEARGWRRWDEYTRRVALTEKMVDHVLDELEWHERLLSDPNGIQVRPEASFPPASFPSLPPAFLGRHPPANILPLLIARLSPR